MFDFLSCFNKPVAVRSTVTRSDIRDIKSKKSNEGQDIKCLTI